MRRLTFAIVIIFAFLLYFAPGSRALMSGVAYTDFANIFTSNQRINAGLGVNVAPGSTGTISASAGLFDQGRSTAIGEWQSVAYSAGNFTAGGSMTWTVDSGDQVAYSYMLIGHTLFLAATLNTTTVGGTLGNELRVAVPGGFTCANSATLGAIRAFDSGTDTVGFAAAQSGAAYVRLFRGGFSNWAASTNNTSIQINVVLQVN